MIAARRSASVPARREVSAQAWDSSDVARRNAGAGVTALGQAVAAFARSFAASGQPRARPEVASHHRPWIPLKVTIEECGCRSAPEASWSVLT